MPRGKPFVCWLSSKGKYRDVALHIGDTVRLRLENGKIIEGKLGCSRRGILPYFVKVGSIKHQAALTSDLMPAKKDVKNGT